VLGSFILRPNLCHQITVVELILLTKGGRVAQFLSLANKEMIHEPDKKKITVNFFQS
jgi:hypothetical protein